MTRNLPRLFVLLVAAIAAVWRLVDVTEWPSPFHPTIQYESALAARSLWQATDPDARTPWFEAVGFTHVVSPPILPTLVTSVYRLTGEETPWVSKWFTTAFWLAAGWFGCSTALRMTGGRWAAALVFAWFVLTPFGIKLSRSFQAEAVLVCAFAAAVWFLARLDRPGWRATLTAGFVCGVAAFVKPGVLFAPLIAGFAGVLLTMPTVYRLPKLAAFLALTVLPSLSYAVLMLRSHVGNKVMPELLTQWWYYESVEKCIATAIGYGALGLAAAGASFAAARREWLLPGLFAGYGAYLAVFTFHCATHDYYHAPLLVLVAVAMAAPLARLEERWAATDRTRFAVAAALSIVFAIATKNPHLGPWRLTPSVRIDLAQRAEEQSRRIAAYRTVRDAVGPGASVVVLGDAYGYPLEYYADVRRAFWPRLADVPILIRGGQLPAGFTVEGYLRELVLRRGFDYFAVTDIVALAEQSELRIVLESCGRLVVSNADVVLYDLRPMREP